MKHKERNPYEGYKTKPRQEKIAPLLEQAITACAKHGGAVEIGNGYVIVDTNKLDIIQK